MPTILLTAPYMLPFVERFRPVFDHYGLELIVPDVQERMEEADILKYAGQFDGAICGDDRYTPAALEACSPRLKVISKWGTGVDSIHAQTCSRLNIQLRRTPNAFTTPVADSVMGYMLAFARRQPWMNTQMKAGIWEKIPGKALTRRARAFGMKVYGTDIIDIDHVFVGETGIEITTLEYLLSNSDFISVNCDLNPTSQHLLNAETLKYAKQGAVVINTARGPIIHEEALVAALQSGQLGGAALDVFEHEPLPHDSPLMRMDNVMLAPHNANSSPAAWERVHWNTIKNLLEGLGLDPGDLKLFNL